MTRPVTKCCLTCRHHKTFTNCHHPKTSKVGSLSPMIFGRMPACEAMRKICGLALWEKKPSLWSRLFGGTR